MSDNNIIVSRQASRMLAFLDSEVEALNNSNKFGLAENYRSSGRSFQQYLLSIHRDDVPFDGVGEDLLTAYWQWLVTRGVRKNTGVFYMRNLRAVYNKAVRLGLAANSRPFSSVPTNMTSTPRRAVTPELIRNISSLDIVSALISQGHDPRKKPFLRMCRELTFSRDIFIFCFCARGLTFVDFAYLRHENIRWSSLIYERRKTGSHIEVGILPQMRDFIDRYATADGPYLFPVITSTDVREAHRQYDTALRRYNKHLNKISQMLGLDISLTSYVSRHSWATAAYHSDMPISHISEAMGHTSEETTRIYLKSFEQSAIDKENQRLMDSILPPALF